MNKQINISISWYKRFDLLLILFVYAITLAFSLSRHELWGDEVHSWNIAKNSTGILDLISNTRYEGHPPLWYILLFVVARFTHDPNSMQYLQFCISIGIAFIFLFHFRLNLYYKILILFGYYFLYEYGVFSRNYALAVLFSFLICLSLNKKNQQNTFLYYIFLFFLSNTHFLAFILAISFQGYFLMRLKELRKESKVIFFHAIIGFLILIPALYFIFPPSNSSLNTSFWLAIWNKDQVFMTMQAPLKALSPIPAWWNYHFWNTHILLEAQKSIPVFKFFNPLVSIGLISSVIYILYPFKKALIFFSINLLMTLAFGLIFPLTTARYVGFIFIAFVVSLFLLDGSFKLNGVRNALLFVLFFMQTIGSFIALKSDWRFPFSNVDKIKSIENKIPANAGLITDYWCLNYLSAFMDKQVFCLGFNKEKSFLLWDTEMKKIMNEKNSYTKGIQTYFNSHNSREVYFITNTSSEDLNNRDSLLFKTFNLQFLEGQSDAIEKYSNINLYKVTEKVPSH